MKSTTLIPRILDAFSREISPFYSVLTPSDEQVMIACRVINQYVGLLQAADLSLSQRQAGALLTDRINADRKARLPQYEAEVDALINAPV